MEIIKAPIASDVEMVKKLVYALGYARVAIGLPRSDYGKGGIMDLGLNKSKEALTEAQAWLERQEGKCSEQPDELPDAFDIGEVIDDALGNPNCSGFSKAGQAVLDYLRPYLTNHNSIERQGKCGEGWQPIETAPKDGIRYLGMIVGDRFYGEPFVCYYDEDEGHICLHQTEAILHRPTHWIHFPKPPTTSQQEARRE